MNSSASDVLILKPYTVGDTTQHGDYKADTRGTWNLNHHRELMMARATRSTAGQWLKESFLEEPGPSGMLRAE